MQELWAKTLAGEADNPGRVSKKTLSLLGDMSKDDAKLFISFGQFVWSQPSTVAWGIPGAGMPLIYDSRNTIYTDKGLYSRQLEHLRALGLIIYSISGYRNVLEVDPAQAMDSLRTANMHYYDEIVTIPRKIKDGYFGISVGECLFTRSGQELFQICKTEAQKNDEFFNYVIAEWKREGLNPIVMERNQQSDATTTEKEKM